MPSRLNLSMGAGLIVCALSIAGLLYGSLLLAQQWEWLHPAAATTVVVVMSIGIATGTSQLAWTIGNKITPRANSNR